MCNYSTKFTSNMCSHRKTNKHKRNLSAGLSDVDTTIKSNVIKSNINNTTFDSIFKCDHCDKSFGRNDNLLRHTKTCKSKVIADKNYKIKKCNRKIRQLYSEIRKKDELIKTLQCMK